MKRFLLCAALVVLPTVASGQMYYSPQQMMAQQYAMTPWGQQQMRAQYQHRQMYNAQLRAERAYQQEVWARQNPYAAQRYMMLEAAELAGREAGREAARQQEEYRRWDR